MLRDVDSYTNLLLFDTVVFLILDLFFKIDEINKIKIGVELSDLIYLHYIKFYKKFGENMKRIQLCLSYML